MIKKNLTCISCPMSCQLELTIDHGEILQITGNECKNGETYARQEFTNPQRVVTTTVTCRSGLWPRLPVKTFAAVPKDKVDHVVRALHGIEVEAPIQLGQVILENVAKTGIAVIATRSLPQQSLKYSCESQ